MPGHKQALSTPLSKRYAFVGGMIASTYITLIAIFNATVPQSTFHGFASAYMFFSYGLSYFFALHPLVLMPSFVFGVGFACYLVGREVEKKELF